MIADKLQIDINEAIHTCFITDLHTENVVVYDINTDSYETLAREVGDAVTDYLEGLGKELFEIERKEK